MQWTGAHKKFVVEIMMMIMTFFGRSGRLVLVVCALLADSVRYIIRIPSIFPFLAYQKTICFFFSRKHYLYFGDDRKNKKVGT